MQAVLSDVYDWWSRTMRGFVGARGGAPRGPVAVLRRDRLDVFRGPADDAPAAVPLDDLQTGLASLRRGRGAVRGPVTLQLDEGRFITRRLSGFTVPLSRQRAMAAIDLGGSTPFRVEEVHAVLTEPPAARQAPPSEYHIIRRSVIDPVVAALAAARLPVRAIALTAGDGPVLPLRGADLARLTGRTRARSFAHASAIAAMALIAVATAGSFAHAWWRYDTAIAETRAISAPLQARAVRVRKALDERENRMAVLSALRTEIAESRTATEVWEEVTRVLPDSAWLTDMTIAEDTVRLSGFSRAAPAIIAPLEGSGMFSNAEFTAPVVRVPGQAGQRFSLRMDVPAR
ncbi:PilN domain-containing protein [Oricola cellulosilytica]|uniref:Fimbrial assembly protein n=1 Tax=Oricola cellulosilytica TaxID=1429082 RepID=A0A4R0PI36_9HYPH|nr:PilN domain-containing protein [Oricola cellulosilytica]TCD16658.1 hypothetical protein E0D97_04400 [Oricola cellulosilytica]